MWYKVRFSYKNMLYAIYCLSVIFHFRPVLDFFNLLLQVNDSKLYALKLVRSVLCWKKNVGINLSHCRNQFIWCGHLCSSLISVTNDWNIKTACRDFCDTLDREEKRSYYCTAAFRKMSVSTASKKFGQTATIGLLVNFWQPTPKFFESYSSLAFSIRIE